MKIICKNHGIQDIVVYAANGRINRKCSVCQTEYKIKKYKKRKNKKCLIELVNKFKFKLTSIL